jgi:antitoxin ParD1/3/4
MRLPCLPVPPELTIFVILCKVPVMNISLTPELESAVKAKVASGLYNNASEIIREALRESLRRESENQWLQREAAIGFAQLEAGQVVVVKSQKEFLAAVRKKA